MADAKTLMGYSALFGGAGGALSNEYCYVGMTENRFAFFIVGKIDVTQVKFAFVIPFAQIERVKVKKSLIPGRYVIHIYSGKNHIKL